MKGNRSFISADFGFSSDDVELDDCWLQLEESDESLCRLVLALLIGCWEGGATWIGIQLSVKSMDFGIVPGTSTVPVAKLVSFCPIEEGSLLDPTSHLGNGIATPGSPPIVTVG